MPPLISFALAVMMTFAGIRFRAASHPAEVAPIGTVTVQGAVKHPGKFPLKPGATLYTAIGGAGGFTDIAMPSKITLLRGGVSSPHNLKRDTEDPTVLQDGDTITVAEECY